MKRKRITDYIDQVISPKHLQSNQRSTGKMLRLAYSNPPPKKYNIIIAHKRLFSFMLNILRIKNFQFCSDSYSAKMSG